MFCYSSAQVFHPSPMRILLAGLFTKSVLVELVLDTINPEARGLFLLAKFKSERST